MGNWKIHDVTEPLTASEVVVKIEEAIAQHGDLPMIVLFDDGAASEYGGIRGVVAHPAGTFTITATWIDPDEGDLTKHFRASQVVKNLNWVHKAAGLDFVTCATLEGADFPMEGDIRMVMKEDNFGGVLVLGVEDPEHGSL